MGRTRGRRARQATNTAVLGAVVAVAGLVFGACSPTVDRAATGVDRAAVAKKATRELKQAQSQGNDCAHVVMTEDKRSTPAPEYPVYLVDATAFGEPCWDKVVFLFAATVTDTPPGYEVEYRKPPFTEGDANQFTVETLGDAFLWLTFTPAASVDTSSGRPVQTYSGNLRLKLDESIHHVEIVRKIIDGDGTVMWMVGLDEKRPFTVDAANDPPRVTLYIAR